MNPRQMKHRNITIDAHQVHKPIYTSVTPSAANPCQKVFLHNDNSQFSRNNSAYTNRQKRPSILKRAKTNPIKLRKLLFAIAFILFSISFVSALSGLFTLGGHFGIISPALGSAPVETTESTPINEWKRGCLPYLYQTDAAWADEPYAGATIKTHGCGPTALSMVYVSLTGRTDKNPVTMARYSEKNGYVDSGSTSWTFMTEGAQSLGLRARELPADKNSLTSQLKMGHPVICVVGPGDFTTEGHFIVLSKINEDGTVEIRDPNSKDRSHMSWDPDRILAQCLNLWTYSI